MRRMISVLLMVISLFLISGCSSSPAAEAIERDSTVFSGGDISRINELLFTDTANIYPSEAVQGQGFLADLMAMSNVSVVSTEEDHVVVKVTAPDMSGFFHDRAEVLNSLTTTAEMSAQVLDYAADAPKVTEKVSLRYTCEEDRITVRYADPAFLDAMLGGLLQAYCDVLDQMITQLGG